jgi:hypothetical protein
MILTEKIEEKSSRLKSMLPEILKKKNHFKF